MSKTYRPVEEQSFALPYFILASLLAASSVWAVYDETYTRRPWKRYQQRFTELQIEKAAEDLQVARQGRASEEVMARERALTAERAKLKAEIAELESTGEHARALAKVAALDVQIYDVKQDWSFRKSEADQYYYEWKHAEHAHHPEAEVRKLGQRYNDTLATAEARLKTVDDLQREQADARALYAGKVERLEAIADDLGRLDRDVEDAERRIGGFQAEYPGVIQAVSEGLGIVDRCQSCHVGVNRDGFEDPQHYAKVYRSHPHRAELLGAHPPERFGCTSCHGGQGSATQELFAHAQGGELGLDPADFLHDFHTHYWEDGLRLKEHEIVLERDSHGKALRTGSVAFLESSCRGCHMADRDLKFAPHLSRARRLVEELGCFGCHNIPGYGPTEVRKVGPSLKGLTTKTTTGWLVRWIANPKSFRPSTAMPNFWPGALDAQGKDTPGSPGFRLREQEAVAIAAYIWSLGDRVAIDSTGYDPSASVDEGKRLVESVGCLGCHALGADDDARVAAQRKDGIPEPPGPGEQWPEDVKVVPSNHGPSLTGIGSKVRPEWVYAWVRDPKAYWPETRMPSLRLTPAEASSIANYLATLIKEGIAYEAPAALAAVTPANLAALADYAKLGDDDPKKASLGELKALLNQGEILVSKYGCYGCHDVSGFEDAGKIAPDLAEFGQKDAYLLDFGDFVTNPDWQSWANFTYNKLKNPRVYVHPRAELKMPQFGLADDEILDIMVLLKSMTVHSANLPTDFRHQLDRDKTAIEEGRRLVENYNCAGCHVVEGKGGYVRTRYNSAQQNTAVPPFLVGEGKKVRPEWFFDFLHQVIPLRPWLDIRMPSFDMPAASARTIVHYFSALDGEPFPFDHQADPPADVASFTASHELFETLKCQSCHPATAEAAEKAAALGGGLAPPLYLSEARLKSRWITAWLRNPEALQPGTRMPAFFYGFDGLDADDWWEELIGKESLVIAPEGGSGTARILAGSLERPEDLDDEAPHHVDWDARFGSAPVIGEVSTERWEPVQVLGFGYTPAQQAQRTAKPDEILEPAMAEVRFKDADGRPHTGVLSLVGADGGQTRLRGINPAAADPEAKIQSLVDYLYLLDEKDTLLEAPKPELALQTPAPGEEAGAAD